MVARSSRRFNGCDRGGRPRLTASPRSGRIAPRAADAQSRQREVTRPRTPTTANVGRREAVGTVYRLPDGRLVLVEPGGRKRTVTP
jgi:hypothetical protein